MKSRHRTIETDLMGRPVGNDGINSQKKGATNERQACKWLYRWTGKDFARVPSSGGLRWKDNPSVCGDVVCQDANFPFIFSVETKHLKSVYVGPQQYFNYLKVNSSIYSIWTQAKTDAERAGKRPMLMLRSNGMPKGEYYIVFYRQDIKDMGELRPVFISKADALDELVGFYSNEVLEKLPYENFAT